MTADVPCNVEVVQDCSSLPSMLIIWRSSESVADVIVIAAPPAAAVDVTAGCAVTTSAVDAGFCVLCGPPQCIIVTSPLPISRCIALLAPTNFAGDRCGGGGTLNGEL